MRTLSGSQNGFGGDLSFGETGDGAGLRGADKICTTIAEMSMPGSGAKGWRAFLSATRRRRPTRSTRSIGRRRPLVRPHGPSGRMNRAGLMIDPPTRATATIMNDLPNENGIPNHTDGAPGCTGNGCPDNHDTLTGSTSTGMLLDDGDRGRRAPTGRAPSIPPAARARALWPASSGMSWMQVHSAAGCAPSVTPTSRGDRRPAPPASATAAATAASTASR